jgi:hypothetical protein
MATSGPQTYPGASLSHWYQNAYAGDAMKTNTIVWHSTEGTSLPTYSGGSIAPNFTAVPNWGKKRLDWYQHFGFDISARALVNKAGGVETNTLNVCQIEIVGTCDPATHRRWGATPHLYMPDLPDWAIRDLGVFARWAHAEHGVPLSSGVTFEAYPASYGSNGVRLSGARWESFSGHCGHQHVPENDHGDPGALPMASILAAAGKGGTSPGGSTSTPSKPSKPAAVPFPGRQYFKAGANNKYVTQLGQQLKKRGFGRHYTSGPGPRWTEADRQNVRDFQLSKKELRGDADGYPGPLTWKLLFS